jgi:gamma-glutamyltranspeptidase/glutathione hydrolase
LPALGSSHGTGISFQQFPRAFQSVAGASDSIVPNKAAAAEFLPSSSRKVSRLSRLAPGKSNHHVGAQAVVNAIEFGMDMRTAVTTPRFHSEEEQLLLIEPQFPESTAKALRALGNDVRRSAYMSRVQAILIRPDTGELEAGPDPRGGAGVGRYPIQPAGGG